MLQSRCDAERPPLGLRGDAASEPPAPARADPGPPQDISDSEPMQPITPGPPPDLRASLRFGSWNVGCQHLRQVHSYCPEDIVYLQECECRGPSVMGSTPKHNWFHGNRGNARHGMPATGLGKDWWQKATASTSSRWQSMATWAADDGAHIAACCFYLPTSSLGAEKLRDVLDDLADRWERQPKAHLRLTAGDLNVEWSEADVHGFHAGSAGGNAAPTWRSVKILEWVHRLGLRLWNTFTEPQEERSKPPRRASRAAERDTTLDYIATAGDAEVNMTHMSIDWNDEGINTSGHAKLASEIEIHGVRIDSTGGRRKAVRTLRQRGQGGARCRAARG